MKPLSVHPAAAREFEEAVVYLEGITEGLGRDFRLEVEIAIKRLQNGPLLCPLHRKTGYRKCFVRRFPYIIFFLDLPERIWVAAVSHGSRKPNYWFGRKPDN